jgi:hypothetical protein
MYVALAVVVHALLAIAAAFIIAPYSLQPIATIAALADLGMASAAMSGIGLAATAKYLSKRMRTISGPQVGLACGVLCNGTMGLVLVGFDFSLVIYLAILAPALLAVLLATLLDRSKSGWQQS